MTRTQTDLLRRALDLLHRILPDDGEPHAVDAPRRCPVAKFAKEYLTRQPGGDMSTAELFQFYVEVAASGELQPLSKSEFLRRLTGVMEVTYGAKKCHNIQREGRSLRGFKSVGIR